MMMMMMMMIMLGVVVAVVVVVVVVVVTVTRIQLYQNANGVFKNHLTRSEGSSMSTVSCHDAVRLLRWLILDLSD